MAVLSVTSVLVTVGVALLIRAEGAQLRGLLIIVFIGTFIPIFAPMLCGESGDLLTEHGPDRNLLTAKTPTGRRTVDLNAVDRVRRFVLPGRFGATTDLLIVTDIRGVRVGLCSAEACAALGRALEARSPEYLDRTPSITRSAQRKISNASVSIWKDLFVPIILSCFWVCAIFLLCVAVSI